MGSTNSHSCDPQMCSPKAATSQVIVPAWFTSKAWIISQLGPLGSDWRLQTLGGTGHSDRVKRFVLPRELGALELIQTGNSLCFGAPQDSPRRQRQCWSLRAPWAGLEQSWSGSYPTSKHKAWINPKAWPIQGVPSPCYNTLGTTCKPGWLCLSLPGTSWDCFGAPNQWMWESSSGFWVRNTAQDSQSVF